MNGKMVGRFILQVVFLLLLCSGSALAEYINLTTGGYGSFTYGGANVYLDARTSSVTVGTGVIDPFVRIQANGTEQGYNTGGGVVLDDVPGHVTSLQLNELNTFVNPTGLPAGSYYRFMLDINQSSSSPYLSLDALNIYANTTNGNLTGALSTLGALVYSLGSSTNCQAFDSASCVANSIFSGTPGTALTNGAILNYALHAGSGKGEDMYFWIPTSLFSAYGSNTYLYMYSAFGYAGCLLPDPPPTSTCFTSNDGFEEWAHAQIGTVPEPGILPLFGLGLVLIALFPMLRCRSVIRRQ